MCRQGNAVTDSVVQAVFRGGVEQREGLTRFLPQSSSCGTTAACLGEGVDGHGRGVREKKMPGATQLPRKHCCCFRERRHEIEFVQNMKAVWARGKHFA